MDELWHAAILDTKLYSELQGALGAVLHHRPSGASQQESKQREQLLTAMKALYTALFSADPLESASPQPSHPQNAGHLPFPLSFSVFVKAMYGKTLTVNVNRQMTTDGLKSAIGDMDSLPADQQRLILSRQTIGGW